MKQIRTPVKLARSLSTIAATILVLLPFHAVFTTWAGANFGHLDLFRIWKEILIVLIGLPTFYLAWGNPKLLKWLKNDILTYMIILYVLTQVVLGTFAIVNGMVTRNALIYSWLINSRFLIFFLICLVLATFSDFLVKNWKSIILIPASVVIIFGLLQLWVLPLNFLSHAGYSPATIPAYHTIDQKPQYIRLQSTLRGPNPLGAYLIIIITLLIAFLLEPKTRTARNTGWLALSMVVLLFTYSRSAWLGLVLSVVLLMYWALHTHAAKQWILTGAAVGALLVASMTFALRNNDLVQNTLFHTDETSMSAESSNAVRANSLESGARSVLHEPFGRGPGTAGPASFRNDRPARIAENYYIQIGQETGILGLGLFIGINVVVAMRLWEKRAQLLARVLLASLVGITLVNLLSHAWADDTLALIWWGLAGAILAPAIIKHKSYEKNPAA